MSGDLTISKHLPFLIYLCKFFHLLPPCYILSFFVAINLLIPKYQITGGLFKVWPLQEYVWTYCLVLPVPVRAMAKLRGCSVELGADVLHHKELHACCLRTFSAGLSRC